MNLSLDFWLRRLFFLIVFWWAGLFLMISIFAIVIPMINWLFHDGWQWMPLEKWVGYVLVCIPIGVSTGAMFTHMEWCQHGGASLAKKWGVGLLGIVFIIYPCAVLVPPWIKKLVALWFG